MKAVRIRAEDAETVRHQLLLEGALDKSRKLIKKDVFIEIPVTESFSIESIESIEAIESIESHLIDQEKPEFYIPKKTLSSILEIPEQEKRLLPKGWQILGDIIIISIREELERLKNDIGRALLSLYPGCRTVLLDHGISGKTRQPSREIIAGGVTETVHKENSCLFKIDAMQLMYSSGNLTEKKRMSRLGRGGVVVDMFAGIGYFSIPMAVHSRPKKIFAIEINPVAFAYLKENVILNCVEDIIEPIAGDCALVTPRGIAERVIMGYLDSHGYIEHGIRALLPGGIIHYHEAVPEAIENRPVERLIEAAGKMGRKVEILDARRIKKYSPGVWHVVVDGRVS